MSGFVSSTCAAVRKLKPQGLRFRFQAAGLEVQDWAFKVSDLLEVRAAS